LHATVRLDVVTMCKSM